MLSLHTIHQRASNHGVVWVIQTKNKDGKPFLYMWAYGTPPNSSVIRSLDVERNTPFNLASNYIQDPQIPLNVALYSKESKTFFILNRKEN